MDLHSSRLLRVLVVDDYPDAGTSLRILLELLGHEARAVTGGREALKMAESFLPDLVFLDIEMPELHGGRVARLLRLLPGLADVRIVATSGLDADDARLEGYRHEFDDYLRKPYSLDRLEDLVGFHECRSTTSSPAHTRWPTAAKPLSDVLPSKGVR